MSLLGLVLALAVTGAPTSPSWLSPEQQVCEAKSKLPKWDRLRSRIKLTSEDVTPQMLSDDRYASADEAKLISAYIAEVALCYSHSGSQTADEQRASDRRASLRLGLLQRGRITFGEYNALEEKEAALVKALAKLGQTMNGEAFRAGMAAANPPKHGTLACTLNQRALAGIDMVVEFNEGNNTIAVSRGAPASEGQISANTITFKQAETRTVINRLTGAIDVTGNNSGLLGAGTCVQAPTRKF
jgi:hypothetical protein